MPIYDIDGNPIEEQFPVVGQLREPSAGEVAWAGVQQGALNMGLAPLGGIARIAGDLVGSPSLSAWGRDLDLNARQASRELTPLGETALQGVMREALGSAVGSAPALVLGRLGPALSIMGGQTYASSYNTAREGNLGVGRSHVYAAIDAIFETAPEAWSLPVLFKPGIPLVRRSWEFIVKELGGEEITAVGQAMNNMLQLRPEMTTQEYWTTLKQVMLDTALVVPPTAAMQLGMAGMFRFARRTTDGVNIRVDGEPLTPPTPTPTPAPVPGAPPQAAPAPGPAPAGAGAAPTPTDPLAVLEGEGGLIPPEPEGPSITISPETATILSSVLTPEVGPEIAADVAPVLTLPDPVPPAEQPGSTDIVSYRDSTPMEISQAELPDPRIYNGVFTGQRGTGEVGHLFVDQLGDGKWMVALGAVRNPNSIAMTEEPAVAKAKLEDLFDNAVTFDSPRLALTYLQNNYQVPSHKNVDFVAKRHMILSMRDAMNEFGVTPTQLQLYGEGIGRVADKAKQFRAKIDPHGMTDLTSDNPLVATQEQNIAGLFSSLEGPFMPTEFAFRSDALLHTDGQLAGTYSDLWKPEFAGKVLIGARSVSEKTTKSAFHNAKKFASALEVWSKRFGLNADKFVLTYEGTSKYEPRMTTRVAIDPTTKRESLVHEIIMGEGSDSFIALAHEFGHALIFHHIHKADSKTLTKLVEMWLDQVNSPSLSWPPNKHEIAELGGVTRIAALQHKDTWYSPNYKGPDPGFETGPAVRHSLKFQEFAADQVAQYIHNNDYFIKAPPEVKNFLGTLKTILEDFFTQMGRKFVPNTTFSEWLNTLAGKDRGIEGTKVDAPMAVPTPEQTKHKPAKKPKIETKTVDTKTKQRNHLIRVFKQEGLWDAEAKEAFDPTGKPEDFRFQEAQDYLDGVGVSWEMDSQSWGIRRVDEPDTIRMREALLTLGKAKGVPREMQSALSRSALSIRNFGRGWRNMLTAVQIRKLYGDKIPAVRAFVNGLEQMFAYRDKWKRRANNTLELMQSAGEEQREKVFDILKAEDASESFFGEFYTEDSQDPASETGRNNIATLSPEAMARYGINEDGAKLYSQIRKDWADALDVAEQLAINEIWRNYGVLDQKNLTDISPEKLEQVDAAVKKMQKAFTEMKAKPYYPHTRFGDYYVTVKEKASGVSMFHQFESLRKAQMFADSMAEDGFVVRVGEMQDNLRPLMNLPWEVMNMLKGELNLTAEQIKEFEDIMKNYTSGESFIKKFKSRKNIAGWEDGSDLGPRVYADYFVKFANYASRKKFTPVLDAAKSQGLKQRREEFGEPGVVGDALMIDRLLSWMDETKDYVMSPDIAFANFKAGVTVFYLGLVPKSALVNAFSVPMMTLPYLGKRFGDLKAMKELAQAYRDVAVSFKRKEAFTEEEWKVIDYLQDLGVINESYATELAAVRDGGQLVELTELGGVKAEFYKLRYAAMWGFHKMEVLNRMVSAVAAYRLARTGLSQGKEFDLAAATFAKEAIQDTQNENAQWNRAGFTRGRKAILTQFLTYSQNAMFQMYGGDPAWQRMLALQLLIAGMMGIPFAKNIDDVIRWFSKRVFGTDTSAELAIRQYLEDTVINPEWILKGASYNILGTGANLYGSLSMGSLIPGTDALAMEGQFADRFANASADIGGAGAATIMAAMKAIASDDPNSVRRFMNAMPMAVKNSYEGYKMLTEGTVVDAAGDPILEATGVQGAAKLLGFQATEVSREREKRFMQKQQAQYWLTRRRIILQMYEHAKKTGDDGALEKADELRDDYNDSIPDDALRLSRQDVRRSLDRRMDLNKKKERGEPGSRRERGLYTQVGDLYSVE